jgi:hypothetical protein
MNDTQPDTTSTAPAAPAGARFHPMVGPVPPLRVGPCSDGGDALRIHPDGAAEVVRTLRAVAERLRRLDLISDGLYVKAPFQDGVSTNMAVQANLMADRARAFNTAWRLQIQGAATQLAEQLAAYQATDEQQRRHLGGQP